MKPLFSIAFTFLYATAFGAEKTQLSFAINDGNGALLPARVHLYDADEKPVNPRQSSLPFFKHHFVCDGAALVEVPVGKLRYEIERGPEWSAARASIVIAEGQTLPVTETLTRFVDLSHEGWWCGETHIHRPLNDVPLLMRAEDLHVGMVITWWNDNSPWKDAAVPATSATKFDGDRFLHPLGGEDERGGGALLYFGLKTPLPLAGIPGRTREWPSSAKWLDNARATSTAWIDAEKPFWWDFPIWLARGVDSIGIANNHLNRSGVYDGEAWGRARDLATFPSPHGNGFYSQTLYYRALNCGLRVPPSAGSASGVLPNPVGYNRLYVHCDGPLTWEKWLDGWRAGRVFVTNGPLLRLTANGKLPGATLRATPGPLEVRIEGRLDSRDRIAKVELVHNGRVESLQLPAHITIKDSGWFLVRAIADVPETFRFASTAPWYVELDRKPAPPNRTDAQFFLDWTRERAAQVEKAVADPEQRAEALRPVREAEEFWRKKIAAALGSLE